MKLTTQLMVANGISLGFIFIFLMFSYTQMVFFNREAVIILTTVTIIAAILSFIFHYFLTRPIQKAIQLISQESKKIADGNFEGKVPTIGPIELCELADRFNHMSDELEKSFAKLHQAEASRKELIANVSHDLRTPLASIQSFVEALQDGVIEDEHTFQKYLNTIRLETTRISHLIDDLFQLSQLDAGLEHFNPEPYHLDNLIIETLESQYLQLEKHNMGVSVHIPDKVPAVTIIPHKIKHVLINLIQNAIRHSSPGNKIEINVKNEMDHVKVVVSDEGEGISKKDLSSVFDRFYRIEKSRNKDHGGSGLGLSIAKSIVELHGGEIGVKSKRGEGSSFWFTLLKYK